MSKIVEIKVFADKINDEDYIKERACKKARVHPKKVQDLEILRKSIDARSARPYFLLRIALYVNESAPAKEKILEQFKNVAKAPEVLVIGAGPAGYFAALELIALGLRPIVLDRGKNVQQRRRDLKAIQQDGVVNPHSNYCYGEGGAGTYSDGKLYTRSHKRGKISRVLQLLVEHGANPEILIEAHPHIGSNKLPKIVSNIRETIINLGGKVFFDHQVTDFVIKDKKFVGVKIADGRTYEGVATILATGHSARDIYKLLAQSEIKIEAKPFALGLRIEHPQKLIDRLQYNQSEREEALPAASYSLSTQIDNKGVFSFCMCPGGLIVPAATSPGEIVINGMSLSKRNSPYSNSGVVTAVELDELAKHGYEGDFASMDFQQKVEQDMFAAGNGSQQAPAQNMVDFVEGKLSKDLNTSSYIPGLYAAPLHEILPDFIYTRLSQGLKQFGKKMRGYFTDAAQVAGVESRTSAPIKVPRNRETLMSDQLEGFFPCGEGAGYAGGILSAAMDGQNVARAIDRWLKN